MKLIRRTYASHKMIFYLSLFSLFCISLGVARIHFTGSAKGLFLVWNLFLAWIPMVISFYLYRLSPKGTTVKYLLLFFAWLLFVPNAPYLITDLIHLKPRAHVPLWFDATLLFLFAFHGLLLGIVSTWYVHETMTKLTSKKIAWMYILFVFVLIGFGIYLGRFLRWNSWDLFVHPVLLFKSSIHSLVRPMALLITCLFSAIMFVSYLVFYQILNLKDHVFPAQNNS